MKIKKQLLKPSRKRTDFFTKHTSQWVAQSNSGGKRKMVLGKRGTESRNKITAPHETPYGFDPHELCYCERSAWVWTGKLWKKEESQELSMWPRDSEERVTHTLWKLEGRKAVRMSRRCSSEGVIIEPTGQRTVIYLVIFQSSGIKGPAQKKFSDHTSQGPHVYGFAKR